MNDLQLQNGDPIWIRDPDGSRQPAVVTWVGPDGRLSATSTHPVAGDSRYVEWMIRADLIDDVVTKRDFAI